MKVINIDSKQDLNEFVGGQKHSQFIQSWQWGEFQRSVSGKVWRVGVEDNGKLIASAKILKKDLPIGKSYFYCGRGPIFTNNEWNVEAAALLFNEIERLAKDEMVMFMRFDPVFDCIADIEQVIGNNSIIKTHNVQPEKTLVLDLTNDSEVLLSAMHQKTRYNIKLAEKKGVVVSEAGKERFEDFWTLLDQTTGRDKFRPHGRSYYSAMLDQDRDFARLIFADYEGKALAVSVVSFFGDSVTYMHGGSSNENRDLMAPYLLQWQSMMIAKKAGYKYYDLHGIDEEKWPGVTRFKLGFGGEQVQYPGTFDLVYDEGWYNIYKMVRKVRRSF